jgi:hypothetical protein
VVEASAVSEKQPIQRYQDQRGEQVEHIRPVNGWIRLKRLPQKCWNDDEDGEGNREHEDE